MKNFKIVLPILLFAAPLVSTFASADQAACLKQKGNAGWNVSRINGMFAEGGKCSSLSDESKAAVKADSSAAALANFRKLKADWLVDFDSENPYTIKYDLNDIRSGANDVVHAPGGNAAISADIRAKAQALIAKIDNLYRAAERLRPDGATNQGSIAVVDNAFDALDGACPADHTAAKCPGYGPGAITSLFNAIQSDPAHDTNKLLSPLFKNLGAVDPSGSRKEFDNLHAILDCRSADSSLAGYRTQAAQKCAADPEALAVKSEPKAGDAIADGLNLNLWDWSSPLPNAFGSPIRLTWQPTPQAVSALNTPLPFEMFPAASNDTPPSPFFFNATSALPSEGTK